MVGKVHVADRVVQELLDPTIGSPEDAIAVRWRPLFLRGIVLIALAQIKLVCRPERYFALVELCEEELQVVRHARRLRLPCMHMSSMVPQLVLAHALLLLEAEASQGETVPIEKGSPVALVYECNDLWARQVGQPKVEITKQQYLVMILDTHASLAQVVLEASLEDLVYLPQSTFVLVLAARQMTVDREYTLTPGAIGHLDLEPDRHGAFVAEAAERPTSCDLARHERLGRYLESNASLKVDSQIQSKHDFVSAYKLLFLTLLRGHMLAQCSFIDLFERRSEETAPTIDWLLRRHEIIGAG